MGVAKRIDLYVDVASLYSFIAFEDVLKNLPALTANGVQVEFHPVVLAAIFNQASGNQPPWALKEKAIYLDYDRKRAQKRVGISDVSFPADFLARTRTISPLRALHFIKANFPAPTFVAALRTMYFRFWTHGGISMVEDENLRHVLIHAAEGPDGSGRRLFTENDVETIMRGRDQMKDALKDTTARASKLGAFGAPWIWVTNAEGKGEPFFGSDRFNHIYEFLDIPFHDIKPLPPREAKL